MAVYDSKISEDVSLSRILDHMIESGEETSSIVKFLKMYDGTFEDIAERSLCIERLFCAPCLLAADFRDARYLLSHLDDIDYTAAMMCTWQILFIAHLNKGQCSYELKQLAVSAAAFAKHNSFSANAVEHPHAGYANRFIVDFDTDIASNGFWQTVDEYSADPVSWSKLFNREVLTASLFEQRIYQLDVFEHVDDAAKYIMMKSLDTSRSSAIEKFALQLVTSDAEPEMKLTAASWLAADAYIYIPGDKTFELIKKAKNYPSIAIHMQLLGEDEIARCIILMLKLRKYKLLAEMAEMDEETMQSNFPVKDLIDYMKKSTCLIKADKHQQKEMCNVA